MNARLKHFVARADVADLVGVATVAGLTLALVFGVFVPVAVSDRLAIARHRAAVQAQQRGSVMAANVRLANTDLERARARLAEAPDRLRPASSLNERLAMLVTIAGECDVSVRDLKPGDATREPKRLAVPLRVAGRGGYPDVTRLLHRLNGEMPDVRVDGFRVTAAGDMTLDLRCLAALPDAPAVAGTLP